MTGPVERQEQLIRTFGVVSAFSEEDGLFYISPDRLGFGFIGGLAPGFDQSTFDALNGLLNQNFPTNTVLQAILYASPDIEETVYAYQAMRDGQKDPLLSRISDKRVEFMRDMTAQPMGRVSGAKLRNMTVVVTVTLKHGGKPPTQEEIREYRELRMAFISGMNAVGMPLGTLTAEKYIRFMEGVLNHKPLADRVHLLVAGDVGHHHVAAGLEQAERLGEGLDGLPLHAVFEPEVVAAIDAPVWREHADAIQFEPLVRKGLQEAGDLRVGDHPGHLRLEDFRPLERARAGGFEQWGIGQGAPEEVGQPAGQFEIGAFAGQVIGALAVDL
jgi:hypothetical protein